MTAFRKYQFLSKN